MAIAIYGGLEQPKAPRRPSTQEQVIKGFRISQIEGFLAASPLKKKQILHLVDATGVKDRFLTAIQEYDNRKHPAPAGTRERLIRGFRESQLKAYISASPIKKQEILQSLTAIGLDERFLAALSDYRPALAPQKDRVILGFKASQLSKYLVASPVLKAKILHLLDAKGKKGKFLNALSVFLNPRRAKSSYRGRGGRAS